MFVFASFANFLNFSYLLLTFSSHQSYRDTSTHPSQFTHGKFECEYVKLNIIISSSRKHTSS